MTWQLHVQLAILSRLDIDHVIILARVQTVVNGKRIQTSNEINGITQIL